MANTEHAYWFREGPDAWNQWRKSHPNIVPDLELVDGRGLVLDSADLSGAILRGCDLSNGSFKNANLTKANLTLANLLAIDLSGADLTNARLDEAILCGSNLTNANFSAASFIAAKLCRAQLSNALGRAAIFTRAKLEKALLVETGLEGAFLDHADFQEALLRRANFSHATLTGSNLSGAELEGSKGEAADLTDVDCRKASITDCNLIGSVFRRTKLAEAILRGSDLSEAVFDQIQFDEVDLTGVILFGSKIINPVWPFRPPVATWFGSLKVRDPVPTHPIQDIQGLPHVLRRTIADAQYLIEVEKRTRISWWQRSLFRLWGITSAFGQSVTRWMAWSLFVLLVFAGAFTRIEFASPQYQPITPQEVKTESFTQESQAIQISPQGQPLPSGDSHIVQGVTVINRLSLIKALYVSTIIFTTLGFSDMTPVSDLGRVLIAIEVTIGYVMLGALLAILANKLARLA
jgi:uncharacterized protein YjbI with pentapeptide repeats